MKKALLTSILIISLFCAYSQDVRPFSDFESEEIHLLDSIHPSAMHIDTNIAVFHGREEEFFTAWRSFLMDFGKYMSDHDFEWQNPTRCFNRIYFNTDGTINTYLYNFKEGTLSKERLERFDALLKEFSSEYKLKIKSEAESKFAQCGPAVYQ